MSSVFALTFFWQVFVTLLVIMDPPGLVPPFLGLTRGLQAGLLQMGCCGVFPERADVAHPTTEPHSFANRR